jgi:hypothetical protein
MNRLKRVNQFKLVVSCLALLVVITGCGDDTEDTPVSGAGGSSGDSGDGGDSGDSGEGGDSGDSGMSGTGGAECDVEIVEDDTCINAGEENVDCTSADVVGPFSGPCSPHGESCHRSSNRAKECMLGPDEPAVMELRVAQSLTDNMPYSSGIEALRLSAVNRSKVCSSEQCLLMRMTVPREGGERVEGPGTTEIAVGRYNCDGTFSFYSDTAAPDREADGHTGADRWAVREAMSLIDPSKDGREQSTITGVNPNREASCNAFYVDASPDSEIDWELCTLGFDILEIDTSVEARDGFGTYDGANWTRPGKYEVYAPISLNDQDLINQLGITFCQLMAFGPLAPDFRTDITCSGTERCLPLNPVPMAQEERTCPYVKLPDSLCPEEDEAEMFGCHLGSRDNVNNEAGYPEELDCTMDAPTEALPDKQGQCCDPLGQDTDGLPACNAYRIVNTFAASAVEITDEPSDELQPLCE